MKDLYTEKCKTLLKEIKEDTNKWKDISCSWINIKMTLLLKVIYRFNAISTKIPMMFFAEIKKSILKFIRNLKEPQIAKTILKKNKAEELKLYDFKTYYKGTVIKTICYWYTDRHIN